MRCGLLERGPCQACRKAAKLEDQSRAHALNEAAVEPFGCERYALAWNAPGPVNDHEELTFLLTKPQAVDPTSGKILPDAVAQLTKGGLSVLREGFRDDEFVKTYVELKASSDRQGKPRDLFGVSILSTNKLREPILGERMLGVFATGLPGRGRHADLAAPEMEKLKERRLRKAILDLIDNGKILIEEFRGGTFNYLTNSSNGGS